jgi:hypothetical protein
MKINVLTIYCALGVAVLAASTHEVSTNKHFEGDDFQIDVDQEVGNVSCCPLVMDTPISLVYHSLHHMLTSFGFPRYDDLECKR